jgi:hypothetical protein
MRIQDKVVAMACVPSGSGLRAAHGLVADRIAKVSLLDLDDAAGEFSDPALRSQRSVRPSTTARALPNASSLSRLSGYPESFPQACHIFHSCLVM